LDTPKLAIYSEEKMEKYGKMMENEHMKIIENMGTC
jgi:hypothetical protein